MNKNIQLAVLVPPAYWLSYYEPWAGALILIVIALVMNLIPKPTPDLQNATASRFEALEAKLGEWKEQMASLKDKIEILKFGRK